MGLFVEGWKCEDGLDGMYIIEDFCYLMGMDEEGYGMIYFFGDGWVCFVDIC